MLPPDSAAPNLVSHIQRHSTEDGPGIRTTVFCMGCPMHCPWCQNPDSMSRKAQLIWRGTRCVGASDCLSVCPESALRRTPQGIVIDRGRCDACGDCVAACPAAALEILGRKMSVADVVQEAVRDKVFYERSGGGVTLSGGDPVAQPDFCLAIMESLKRAGVHLALDTCGGVSWQRLEPLVGLADLVLFDVKTADEEAHLRYTGVPLRLVLNNARAIARLGRPMWIRTPIIPDFTDSEESIRRIARFIRKELPTVERYELLAYNNLGRSKYERLGLEDPLADRRLMTSETMERLSRSASAEGVPSVRWSGMTRSEDAAEIAQDQCQGDMGVSV